MRNSICRLASLSILISACSSSSTTINNQVGGANPTGGSGTTHSMAGGPAVGGAATTLLGGNTSTPTTQTIAGFQSVGGSSSSIGTAPAGGATTTASTIVSAGHSGTGGTSSVAGSVSAGGAVTLGGATASTSALGGTAGGVATSDTKATGGVTTSVTAAGGASSGGVAGGGAAVGGGISTGGAAAGGAPNGGAGTGGAAIGGAATGGTSAICTETATRSCVAQGTCAGGTQSCSNGQWGPCSIQPAASDTCTPGNDDNCNGTPNDNACTVKQISAGASYTCALLSDNRVRCWGDNGSGQLGNGSKVFSAKPVLVSGLTTAASIDTGPSTACAVLTDGSVSCWGSNQYGQLGSGTTETSSSVPVKLSLASPIPASKVTIGGTHSCMLVKADGSVRCWGRSTTGQLGDGSTSSTNVTTPVVVTGLTQVVSISAGYDFTCAVLSDTSVQCWGNNNHGQIGTYATSSAIPVSVADHAYQLGSMIDVAAARNGYHAGALTNDGRGRTWGYGYYGQLGNNYSGAADADAFSAQPVVTSDGLNDFSGMTQLTSGGNHMCAVLTDNSGVCWGYNAQGQLGNGTTGDSDTPSPITMTNINSISGGVSHTCAVSTTGTAYCWGSNSTSQLGDMTTTQRTTPVKVLNLLP